MKATIIFLFLFPCLLSAQRANGLLPERKAPVKVEYRRAIKPVQPVAVLLPRKVYSIAKSKGKK